MDMNLDAIRSADAVQTIQNHLASLPQYEPVTKNYFHGGMLCREVFRHKGIMVVGRVHKKEHFYLVASGTVLVTTPDGAKRITGPQVVCSIPGTKRVVYAETDAVCMTFHRTDATTVEDAETELVESDPLSLYDAHNKPRVLT